MTYLAASTAVTDEIHRPGGGPPVRVGGGAGWYALSGMRLWTKEALLLSGIGRDFLPMHRQWFDDSMVSIKGLRVVGDESPRTIIRYSRDNERVETPVHGHRHYRRHEARVPDIANHCADCRGLYVFRNVDDLGFWAELDALRHRFGFSVMWEIAADAARPNHRKRVTEIAGLVDILSINKREAATLLGEDDDAVEATLKTLGSGLVYYRRGSDGASLITSDRSVRVPAVDVAGSPDPTGAGNSSSGAVLVGFCENRPLEEIGMMGSISAAYTVAQFGPIPLVDGELQSAAGRLLAEQLRSRGEGCA